MRRIQAEFISSTVAAVRAGVPGTTVLRGPAGIGKTWALDRIAEQVAGDALVLRCSGHPAEHEVPYAHLSMLLLPLRRHVEAEHDGSRALLSALAWQPSGPVDDLAVATEVLDVLATAAVAGPVVLLVDDVHWIDPATRFALTFAVRRRDAEPLHVVLVVRDGEDHDLDGRHLAAEETRLAPLDDASSRQLLLAQQPTLAPAVADRIVATAGGLPLALVEIPLELDDAQREGRAPLPDPLPTGAGLGRIYRRRLADLTPEARTVLLLAAVEPLDRPEFDRASELLGLPDSAVDAAARSGLLHIDATRVSLTHPTARTAVLADAEAPARERVHRAVATLLAPTAPERAAPHLLAVPARAGADGDLLVLAASTAEQRGALDAAGRWWLGAADRTADRAERTLRRHRAALAWFRAGRPRALGPLVTELVAEAADAAEAARLQAMAILAGTDPTDPAGWAEQVDDLARQAATVDVGAAADLHLAHAAALTTAGHVLAAEEAVRSACAFDPARAEHLGTRLALDSIGVLRGRPGAGNFLCTAWADELDDAELLDPALPVSPAAALTAWLGHPDRAAATLARQRRALDGSTALTPVALLAAQEAVVLEAQGDWDGADTAFAQATALGWGSGIGAALGPIRLRHALLLAARGRDEAVAEVLTDPAVAELTDRPLNAHAAHRARGLLALGHGRHAAAAAELEEAARLETALGLGPAGPLGCFGDRYEAACHLGTQADLSEALAAFVDHATAAAQPGSLAIAARCRALAEPDDPDEAFEAALRLHLGGHPSFERARTELAWGRSLRRRRRRGAARAPLHRAATAFAALGATPWLAAAERELAACGERRSVSIVRDPALSQLTPRELDVCRLVAGGASNAEAAARLVVSRRTAEYHLANAMRKLHLTSRVDLRALFPSEPDDTHG